MSTITGVGSATDTSTSTALTDSSTDRLANKTVFMQLLVAQLKNQNPLNPADGTQFVSQLAQFSELEQVMGSKQELTAIREALTGTGATTGTTADGVSGS